jgi:RecJ-like exonuclease
MIKKFIFLAIISLLTLTTTSVYSQNKTTGSASDDKIVAVNPDNFQDVAADMVGKQVEIQGMVVHVCKHGGKKMFIIGENPDVSVKITASDKVSVFEPELEGSTVYVTGIVEPMDDVEEIQQEIKTEGNVDAAHENQYHKPQFSISCLKVKEIKD